ncbi:MAG: hypothetical protein GSR72_06535, partial [Desulfurococcales archaeon]|nr:hypothetical protein [Desulfurococcales archaeon]
QVMMDNFVARRASPVIFQRLVETNNPHSMEVLDISASIRRLAKRLEKPLYSIISQLSEIKTKTPSPVPTGIRRFIAKRAIMRKMMGRGLDYAYPYVEKQYTILALDNSGSMQGFIPSLVAAALAALGRKDVEVYFAPNGYVTSIVTSKGRHAIVKDICNYYEGGSCTDALLEYRKTSPIIFVGDMHGMRIFVENAVKRGHQVLWIAVLPDLLDNPYENLYVLDELRRLTAKYPNLRIHVVRDITPRLLEKVASTLFSSKRLVIHKG